MAVKMDKRVTLALVGTAGVCGVGLAYYVYKQYRSADEIIEIELKLESSHLEWLRIVSEKYTEGNLTEALKKVLEHCQAASEDPETAEAIFEKVRCNSCGKKEKVPYTASLPRKHVSFIAEAAKKYKITAGNDKCVRVMLEYAINDSEESSVFSD